MFTVEHTLNAEYFRPNKLEWKISKEENSSYEILKF